jgi:hypothetical protein
MRLHSYSHFELVCRHIAKQQKGEKEDHMSDLAPFVATILRDQVISDLQEEN